MLTFDIGLFSRMMETSAPATSLAPWRKAFDAVTPSSQTRRYDPLIRSGWQYWQTVDDRSRCLASFRRSVPRKRYRSQLKLLRQSH
jgi:hypothetical protein